MDIPFFGRNMEKNLKKLTSLRNKNSKFYFVGDFNCDVLKINANHNISEFIEMMYSYNAIMLVNRPTRFPIGDQPGDPSIIDHFYTNDPQSIKKFAIVATGISPDHFGLLAIIENTSEIKKKKAHDFLIRDYKNTNIPALREELSLFDPTYLDGLHIDRKFELFQLHIKNCIENHIPTRKLTVREKNPR